MRHRALAAGVALVALAACASASGVPFSDPREVAGAWRGRFTGRSGSGIATVVVKDDGSFTGTMYLDGGDQDFSGAITVVRPGQARYRSSQGMGSLALEDRGGARALRFQPDGGGVASLLTRAR